MGLDITFCKRRKEIKEVTKEDALEVAENALYFLSNSHKFGAEFLDNFVANSKLKLNIPLELYSLRKHNWIYKFFEDKLAGKDCYECDVERSEIGDFIWCCDKILENKSIDVAKQLLPTCDGFFFGSTEYDDEYFEKIKLDREIFRKMLDELGDDEQLMVYFSY